MHSHQHQHNNKSTNPYTLYIAAAITLSYALIEALVGWWSNSLALMSDAGHMLTDTSALLIASLGAWFATRAVTQKFSFGFGRAEFLTAFINSLLMLVVVIVVIYHAIERLASPLEVKGEAVTLVAFIGLLLNVAVLFLLKHGESDLNRRAAILHVMADLLASVAALLSGIVILFTGWSMIDPILSLIIMLLVLYSTWHLIMQAVQGLMAGVPPGYSLQNIGQAMAEVEGVISVHDLHIWSLTSSQVSLSAHVVIDDLNNWQAVRQRLCQMLNHDYAIEHVTLQPEPEAVAVRFVKENANDSSCAPCSR